MLLTKERRSSSIEEASTSADEAFREIKLLVRDLRDVMDSGGKVNIEQTLSNLKEFSDLLASINREDNRTIHEIINRLNSAIAKFDKMSSDFSRMSRDISKTAKDYSKVADTVNRDLPSIMRKIDSITTYLDSVSRTLDEKLPPVMDKLSRLEDNLNNTIENNSSRLNRALTSVDASSQVVQRL